MANLLNFNSSRTLEFSTARPLTFDSNRDLIFNMDRELNFNPTRDLGFGKRGVLFRGYVCANCGAIVSVDATSCDECGAVFEQPEPRGPRVGSLSPRPTPATRTAPGPRHAPPVPAAYAPPRTPPPSPYGPPAPPPRMPPAPPAAVPPPPPAEAAGQTSHFCPYCGARSWPGDAFCWNCGARFTGDPRIVTASATGGAVPLPPTAESVRLPPKKAHKVVKDWRDTGKSLEEYAEEK
ncbi:MAG TPA: hypothetical protein VI915_03625 [Thermoplasmata archaeon]|nr:hypothetical protein [Thermoplasmata archaeon]